MMPLLTPVFVRHAGHGFIVGRRYPLAYDVLFNDGRRGCGFPPSEVEKRGEAPATQVVSGGGSVRVLGPVETEGEVNQAVRAHNRYLRVVK